MSVGKNTARRRAQSTLHACRVRNVKNVKNVAGNRIADGLDLEKKLSE